MNCPKCGFGYDESTSKFCPECGAPSTVFCSKCGKQHSQKFCPECGNAAPDYKQAEEPAPAYQQPAPQNVPPSIVINNANTNTNTNTNFNTGFPAPVHIPKSKITALLLCIFLGYWGIHHFYVGKTGMGLLYLFTGGLCGIGWLIDIVLILVGSFRDKWGMPLV